MKILKFNESWKSDIEDRVDTYIKYAKIKYPDLTADEVINKIMNKNDSMRFNSDEEKILFKEKWNK